MCSKHTFQSMCCHVNMYCDRDTMYIVIVTYHVLISVQVVSYVVSIHCKLISLWFTSRKSTSKNNICCVASDLGLGLWPRLEELMAHRPPQRTQSLQLVTEKDASHWWISEA